MEKVNKKRKFLSIFEDKGIVISTIIIAGVVGALFFIMQMNKESFAADYPSQIKTEFPNSIFTDSLTDANQGDSYRYIGAKISGEGDSSVTTLIPNTRVFPFYARNDKGSSSKFQVFCSEKDILFAENTTYSKSSQISDYGLLYLINQLSTNEEIRKLDPEIRTWVSQIAIWNYLYEKEAGKGNNKEFKTLLDQDKNGNNVKSVNAICKTKVKEDTATVQDCEIYNSSYENENGNPSYQNLYEVYVEDLVNEALDYDVPHKFLKVDIEDAKTHLTEDEKYYQSSAITVDAGPEGVFKDDISFKINSSEDALLVREDGTVVNDTDKLEPYDNYYIRIPVDKINNDNKKVNIKFTASYETIEGNYYVAEKDGNPSQKILSIDTIHSTLSKVLGFEFYYTPEVPNTGMSTSQTIYFIGLIILVGGIGVVFSVIKISDNN